MAGTITHSWNGTILTITSDSGTSACDLKGAKGDDGPRGPQGIPGDANLIDAVDKAEKAAADAETALSQLGTARDEAVAAAAQVKAIVAGNEAYTKAESDSRFANAIKPTATGVIATANDSGNYPLQGLSIYGKTTQAGTPTPTSPIDLVNCGVGSIGVNVCGKNILSRDKLLNGLQVAQAGAAAAIKEGYGWRKEITADMGGVEIGKTRELPYLRPGVVYTLSFVAWCDGTGKLFVDCYPDSLPEMVIPITGIPTRYIWTFTSNNPEMANAVIRTHGYSTSTDKWVVRVVDIKLEIGGVATEYEAYKDGGGITLNTPNGLPGIPVSSGGNYTDSTGQQWLADEIDLAAGVYRKHIQSLILNGTENWAETPTMDGKNNRFMLTIADKKLENSNAEKSAILCDAYSTITPNEGYMGADYGIQGQNDSRIIHINDVRFRNNNLAELKAALSAMPITVMYVLETPTETALTAAEIAAFKALYSLYPNTTVYTDANAGIAATYVADTKTYIDNKFNELSTALVAMGG